MPRPGPPGLVQEAKPPRRVCRGAPLISSFLLILLMVQSDRTSSKERKVAVEEVRVGTAAMASLFIADVPRQQPRGGL